MMNHNNNEKVKLRVNKYRKSNPDKVKEIKGTVIEWVEGKDPTKKKIKKK